MFTVCPTKRCLSYLLGKIIKLKAFQFAHSLSEKYNYFTQEYCITSHNTSCFKLFGRSGHASIAKLNVWIEKVRIEFQEAQLNVITLGMGKTDNTNQKITITKQTLWLADCEKGQMGFGNLGKNNHSNKMVTSTAITLSSAHCIILFWT